MPFKECELRSETPMPEPEGAEQGTVAVEASVSASRPAAACSARPVASSAHVTGAARPAHNALTQRLSRTW